MASDVIVTSTADTVVVIHKVPIHSRSSRATEVRRGGDANGGDANALPVVTQTDRHHRTHDCRNTLQL